nr:hypothetical protein [Brevibacterium linens]
MLVKGDDLLRGLPGGRQGDRDDFVRELAFLRRRGGPTVRFRGVGVLVLSRDLVFAAQVLRGFDHSTWHRVVIAASSEAATDETVLEFDIAALDAPTDLLVEERCAAHRFRAAGDDEISEAGRDHRMGIGDRLQAGSTATIDLAAGHGSGQACVESDDATDGRGLHVRVAVAEDDVIDGVARKIGLFEQSGEHLPAELLGRNVLELSAECSHGGAEGFADDDVFGHRVSLWVVIEPSCHSGGASISSASLPKLISMRSDL